MTDKTNGTNATTEIRWLNRRQIIVGDLQPRKHFEQSKIDELVGSFREHGFDPGVSHLLVRPLGETRIEHEEDSKHWFIRRRDSKEQPEGTNGWVTVGTAESAAAAAAVSGAEEMFELVLGERRYRASEIVELDAVPVVVKELDDVTVLKLQLVENMQRESLTPMEEAMAFQRLNGLGQTLEEIGKSVGMTERVVQDRILLCRHFGTEIATAIDIGEISATHGLVLAQVPSPALRNELLQKVLHPPDGSSAPWPISALRAHVKMDYVIDLRSAKFDTKDETLLPVDFEEGHEFENEHRLFGGACTDCPFNVQSEARVTVPMCTNPQCFQMKEIAAHERWRELVAADPSEEREVVTLSHAENAELWNESGRALAFHSPYVELDQSPAASELRSDVEVAYIWRHLIKGQAVPIVLGRDTAGKAHELVRHDLAKKAAHLNGHKIFRDSGREERTDQERSSTASAPAQSRDERSREESLAEVESRKAEVEIRNAEMTAIVAAAEGKECRGQFRLPKAFYQQLLFTLLSVGESFDTPGADSITRAVMSRRGLELDEASVTGLTIGEQFGLAVEMLIALEQEGKESWAAVFGVKLAAVRKAAEKAVSRKGAKVAKEEEKKG